MEVFQRDVAGKAAGELEESGVETDRDFHAGVVIRDDGREERCLAELADLHDLRKMLVLLGEAVLAGRGERKRLFLFVFLDHFFAAAAVAGEGYDVERVIDRKDACVDERIQDRDRAAGVAAGDGDLLCFADGLVLLGREFREAVDPVFLGAVGRGGVKDANAGAFGGFHNLAGGIIGETKEHEICILGIFHDGGDIFSFFIGEREKLDVASGNQTIVQSQARGPRFTNNEYFRQFLRSHNDFLLSYFSMG